MIKNRSLCKKFFLMSLVFFGAVIVPIRTSCSIKSMYDNLCYSVKDKFNTKIEAAEYFVSDNRISAAGLLIGLTGFSAIRALSSTSKALWFINPLSFILSTKRDSIFSIAKSLLVSVGGLSLGGYGLYYLFSKTLAVRPLLKAEFILEDEIVMNKKENIFKEHPVIVGQTKECISCYSDKDPKDFYKMSCCGNEFCQTCLQKRISDCVSDIAKNKNTKELKCICGKLMKDNDLNNLASKANLKIIKSAREIELFDLFRHCNTPGCSCGYGINKGKDGKIPEGDILCPGCKKRYCADCQYRHMSNETCQQAKERVNKKELEGLSEKGRKKLIEEDKKVIEVVKNCPNPKCGKPLQKDLKNNGCNHIICGNCGLHFCWECLGYDSIDKDHKNGGYPHNNFYSCPAHVNLARH